MAFSDVMDADQAETPGILHPQRLDRSAARLEESRVD
jgi:hypothetical protein